MHQNIVHQRTTEALAHLLEQQRRVMNQCPCGAPGTVYADDERTPLCGRCWWQIYGEESDEQC